MSYIELAWIREGERLIIGPEVEALLGRTAGEVAAMPLEDLMTPDTLRRFNAHYYTGPAGTIAVRAFEAHLVHRDGHVVCCRLSIVCRYDGDGHLVKAWGCARHQQRQYDQNALLAWWPAADPVALDAVIHMVKVYAAL